MEKRYYLDYNSTTRLLPAVLNAMRPYLEDQFGNPSSIHFWGRHARAALDDAREELAQLLGAQAKEIVFVSGGTEANNLAILGVARALRSKGNHLITCATEHHSVLDPCRHLKSEGFDVTVLPVDSHGQLNITSLENALRSNTILVSIMSANNETGTLQPIQQIGALCRQRGILFHCDAVQSFGKEMVDVRQWKADLLTISAHKFYGPKGAAALYVRTGVSLERILWGGTQENERRGGTENVAAIVGMATAARHAVADIGSKNQRLFRLTEKLWEGLSSSIDGICRNGHSEKRLGNTLNASFEDCDGESLPIALDLEGIGVSNGSACMVGSVQPSHVLRAMGVPKKRIQNSIRFSLGVDSKEENIPEIVECVSRVVKRLRNTSDPIKSHSAQELPVPQI